MKYLFKFNNRALLIGYLATVMLFILFAHTDLIPFNADTIKQPLFLLLNGISFILIGLLLSVLMTRYTLVRVLFLLGILVLASLADHHLSIDKNPITIPLIILFWVGLAYLILPNFFKKYRVAIASVLGLLLSYYFYHFFTTVDYKPEDRGSFANLMIIPIPFFLALWFYEQWRWMKTLESEKTNAELALLKSQINPHFFFNTLNNLYGLVVEQSEQAPEVVLKLSDMMRYTIYEGKKEIVSLKDEIKYLETYIQLHKIRHQKIVDIRFDHEIDGTLQLAPLLFIILLENAFKHGVEKVREGAFIHLNMTSQGRHIIFDIKNSRDSSSVTSKQGIGLDNLRRRLAYLYPNRHELNIESRELEYTVQLKLSLI